MSISASSLFEDVSNDIGVGTGNDRLAGSFVRAVNRSLDQLSLVADLATRLSHISSTDATIALDKEYEYIVLSGIYFWLYRTGFKPRDPRIAVAALKDTNEQWKEAMADYVVAESNETQADSTNDMCFWGVLS